MKPFSPPRSQRPQGRRSQICLTTLLAGGDPIRWQARSSRVSYVYRRPSGIWYLAVGAGGRVCRRSLGTRAEKVARAALVDQQRQEERARFLGEKAAPAGWKTLAEWSETCLAHSRTNKAASTWPREAQIWKRILETLEVRTLAEITPRAVEQYKARRVAVRQPATVNRELCVLRAAITLAVDHSELAEDPIKGKVAQFPDTEGIVRWLSPEEEPRLLAALPEWLATLARFLLHTGVRLGEALGLTWSDVSLELREARIQKRKNRKALVVPLNRCALEVLRGQPRNVSSPLVFPVQAKRFGSRYAWGRWKRAVAKSGIPPFRIHDCRHTFASRLVQRGVPLNVVKQLLGHKRLASTLRYAHLANANLVTAVRLLETGAVATPSATQGVSDALGGY